MVFMGGWQLIHFFQKQLTEPALCHRVAFTSHENHLCNHCSPPPTKSVLVKQNSYYETPVGCSQLLRFKKLVSAVYKKSPSPIFKKSPSAIFKKYHLSEFFLLSVEQIGQSLSIPKDNKNCFRQDQ